MSEATDIFFKKIVTLRQGNHRLQFRTSQELFSSQDVDVGTKFLLRTLAEAAVGRKVLDVGCGYGPIGLALKRADKRREVHLLDRDALALDYTRQNAALNQLTADVEVYGSLGYEAVTATDFDLIVSHIPSKLGEETLSHFLLDGRFHLATNGFMAVVIAPPQAETASAILQAEPDVTILLEETSARYTVFHYRFAEERPSPPETSQLLHTYHRDTMQVAAGKHSFLIQTARGLPEFDELGHHTKLLLKAMTADKADGSNRLLIFNPGQGHIAVAAWHLYQPQQMVIVDRDLLSLHFTQHNLLQNGCPAERLIMQHQVGVAVEQTTDRIIGVLGGTEGLKGAEWTMAQAMAQLGENGRILAAANSHLISQLTPRLPKSVKVMERKRRKGNSLIVLQKA